jgi:lipoic acid synthetase
LVRSSYHAADFRPELDIMDEIEKLPLVNVPNLQPEDLPLPSARADLLRNDLAMHAKTY